MSHLVANAPVSQWTLHTMNAIQMAEAFPDLRRFFDCGFVPDHMGHGDGIVGLKSPMQNLRINLENGEFE